MNSEQFMLHIHISGVFFSLCFWRKTGFIFLQPWNIFVSNHLLSSTSS